MIQMLLAAVKDEYGDGIHYTYSSEANSLTFVCEGRFQAAYIQGVADTLNRLNMDEPLSDDVKGVRLIYSYAPANNVLAFLEEVVA